MNTMRITTGLKAMALLGALSATLTGCLTREGGDSDYASDGQGAFLVSEMDQMGQSLGGFQGAGLAKAGAAGATKVGADFVIEGELLIDPWSYQAECQCFVRKARYTGFKGFERERLDSVTFLDAAGEEMDAYRPALVSKVLYRRNVHHEKGAREVDVRIDITVDIKTEAGDSAKVGVWNGTMSGTFNGQEFKSATVTNVVRPFSEGRFRFPESGSIELTRPVYKFNVDFLGEGRAKVTIKNRRNGRVHILWVDKTYQETEPAAE